MELGITTGYGDGRFGPADYITRAQMAVFLERALLGPECANVKGTWKFTNNGVLNCISEGDTITEYPSGSGIIAINQDGCNVSWNEPNSNELRSGTIDGNSIQVSGIFAIPSVPGFIFTENNYSAIGTVDEHTINLNGSGIAIGTYEGVAGSCEGTDTLKLTRCFDVAVAVLDGGPISTCVDCGVWFKLAIIKNQAMNVDPDRVIAEEFPADTLVSLPQETRVNQWIDKVNKDCVPAKVILVGYSLGGDAVRKGNFPNICSRMTIDPIGEEFILSAGFNQRNVEAVQPEHSGGYFINYLSDPILCKERYPWLCGYRISGAENYYYSGTDHSSIVPSVGSNEVVVPLVRDCLGLGENL